MQEPQEEFDDAPDIIDEVKGLVRGRAGKALLATVSQFALAVFTWAPFIACLLGIFAQPMFVARRARVPASALMELGAISLSWSFLVSWILAGPIAVVAGCSTTSARFVWRATLFAFVGALAGAVLPLVANPFLDGRLAAGEASFEALGAGVALGLVLVRILPLVPYALIVIDRPFGECVRDGIRASLTHPGLSILSGLAAPGLFLAGFGALVFPNRAAIQLLGEVVQWLSLAFALACWIAAALLGGALAASALRRAKVSTARARPPIATLVLALGALGGGVFLGRTEPSRHSITLVTWVDVAHVAFSPDGRTLACTLTDGTVALVDVSTVKLGRSSQHEGASRTLFLDDGRLYVPSTGRVLSVPDLVLLETRKDDRIIVPHASTSVVDPTGQLTAEVSATGGGTDVLLRRASDGRVMRVLRARGQVRMLAFSPDGRALAAPLHGGGEVVVWHLGGVPLPLGGWGPE